ncbi:MAG: hypothetical protein WC831_04910 [Parcubacteria group bacterium]|jgi:hypothetical protein
MAKKKKQRKKAEKTLKITPKYLKTPEDIFFGLLVVISVVFATFCLMSAKSSMPEAKSTVRSDKSPELENNIEKIVSGYPIDKMAPYIAKKDNKVAAYLVAIAKKESNWGKNTPKKDGKECYNYWGFRGSYNLTASGYSCFDSPAQAVNVVGKRIGNLVAQNIDTPREMVVWKCGKSCSSHSSPDASKWVRDVDFYYRKLYD